MKPILVFQTDFTYKEAAVAAMYGVVKSVDRDIEIIDATHEIPQYDTWSASYRLFQFVKFWPKDTIFVSVVDPGVGTSRKAAVAKTSTGHYIVTPDNGSLTHMKKWVGIEEIREIDESVNRLKGHDTEDVSIFHGRDLFGYCAARLASGAISYEEVGPRYDVDDIVEHDIKEAIYEEHHVTGNIEIADPNFGNQWTNVDLRLFKKAGFEFGDTVRVIIKEDDVVRFDEEILFVSSFGDAKLHEPMIYNNELLKLGLAVNQDNFAEKYSINFGPSWTIDFSK